MTTCEWCKQTVADPQWSQGRAYHKGMHMCREAKHERLLELEKAVKKAIGHFQHAAQSSEVDRYHCWRNCAAKMHAALTEEPK